MDNIIHCNSNMKGSTNNSAPLLLILFCILQCHTIVSGSLDKPNQRRKQDDLTFHQMIVDTEVPEGMKVEYRVKDFMSPILYKILIAAGENRIADGTVEALIEAENFQLNNAGLQDTSASTIEVTSSTQGSTTTTLQPSTPTPITTTTASATASTDSVTDSLVHENNFTDINTYSTASTLNDTVTVSEEVVTSSNYSVLNSSDSVEVPMNSSVTSTEVGVTEVGVTDVGGDDATTTSQPSDQPAERSETLPDIGLEETTTELTLQSIIGNSPLQGLGKGSGTNLDGARMAEWIKQYLASNSPQSSASTILPSTPTVSTTTVSNATAAAAADDSTLAPTEETTARLGMNGRERFGDEDGNLLKLVQTLQKYYLDQERNQK